MSKVNGAGSKRFESVSGKKKDIDSKSTSARPAGICADRLEVSSEAQKIDELFGRLADVEEINADRVESIRESLKKNAFPINYQQLADRILELSDELNSDES